MLLDNTLEHDDILVLASRVVAMLVSRVVLMLVVEKVDDTLSQL